MGVSKLKLWIFKENRKEKEKKIKRRRRKRQDQSQRQASLLSRFSLLCTACGPSAEARFLLPLWAAVDRTPGALSARPRWAAPTPPPDALAAISIPLLQATSSSMNIHLNLLLSYTYLSTAPFETTVSLLFSLEWASCSTEIFFIFLYLFFFSPLTKSIRSADKIFINANLQSFYRITKNKFYFFFF